MAMLRYLKKLNNVEGENTKDSVSVNDCGSGTFSQIGENDGNVSPSDSGTSFCELDTGEGSDTINLAKNTADSDSAKPTAKGKKKNPALHLPILE